MEFKILGSIIVILVFSIYGFYLSYKIIYRQNDLLEMKRAILILTSEMRFLSTSIIDAIEHIENSVDYPIKNLFSYFKFLLLKNDGDSIDKLWEKALYSELKSSFFNKNDLEKFKIIGKSICNYDKDFNISSFNLINEYIDQSINEINLDKKQNLKMYQSLSVLFGIMIVILLV